MAYNKSSRRSSRRWYKPTSWGRRRPTTKVIYMQPARSTGRRRTYKKKTKWLKWVLILLGLGAVIYFFPKIKAMFTK